MKLQESITGFYYVGTKRAVITKYVNVYKRGYASGKLHESPIKSVISAGERIRLDLNDADKPNLLMYMWIMAHTPQALMQKANT